MKTVAAFAIVCLLVSTRLTAGAPSTLNNDDSCDVIVTPAATLLLPYFEVDVSTPIGETTLFSIVNTTQYPQIARVTIWTDLSYPLLSFNVFLTGYDVQSINLYDILVRGRIADPGTSSDWYEGRRSRTNQENPRLDLAQCASLPARVTQTIAGDLRSALTNGHASACGGTRIGETHAHATGYVTIDAVRSCGSLMPTDPGYFTSDLLYDNVLSGDYQQVNGSQNFAQGGTLVHIRAVPEGGTSADGTNLERTFYSGLQNGGTADRRQPLPSMFVARWIDGGPTQFATSFKIWREGLLRIGDGCVVGLNRTLALADVVRFDEQENPSAFSDCPTCAPPVLAATSRTPVSSSQVFPPSPDDGAVAGWMYLNLDHQAGPPYKPLDVASQNWVVVSMEADGRYSADLDAGSFGNGCTPATPVTAASGDPAIAPAANVVHAPFATGAPATINNDDSCDVKVGPAATLLLPYFQVDLTDPAGETTLFSVTNVTQVPQIARVTIWTDRAYPLFTFNLFLTGYDVQSINLYDVLARGIVATPGTSSNAATGSRSAANDANPLLDVSKCATLPSQIQAALLAEMQKALTVGSMASCGTARIGDAHTHAIGYVTIDLVQNCGASMPMDPGYFTTELLYDNVLYGDFQQVNSFQNFAQSNAMVHIRAIPEGGTTGSATTSFSRTFYSRLQGGGTADRRQPLPSTFGARWISGGPSGFDTGFKIWREATTTSAGCNVTANAAIEVVDLVRFDEEENPTSIVNPCCCILCPPFSITSPATVSMSVSSTSFFPPNPDASVAGWMYLNLDSASGGGSQSWVVVSMRAEGRYSVDFDATSFGNGCSPPYPVTDEDGGPPAIGPAANLNPDS